MTTWEEQKDGVKGAVQECYPISSNHHHQLCPCKLLLPLLGDQKILAQDFSSFLRTESSMLRRPGASSKNTRKHSDLSLVPVSSD